MKLIQHGQILDDASGKLVERDILVSEDRIEAVDIPGSFSSAEVEAVVDANGCIVTPGFIDLHVHLREPGQEWKETIVTGARAAVAGGYTTVCCMPNTSPINDKAEITSFIVRKGQEAGLARVMPVGAVSLGSESKELAPFAEMREAGAVAFTDDGHPVKSAGLMRRALEWGKLLGIPLFGHEEEVTLSGKGVVNESSRTLRMGLAGWPKAAEEIYIARDIELSRLTGGHMHFLHVTTARGVELIRRAKADGIPVTAEACPHHLLMTEKAVEGYNTAAKMNPPLREEEDCEALLAGLRDGTIDCISTDHAPHDVDTKRVEFDNASFGIVSLQSTLPLMLGLVKEGKLSFARLVEALTRKPALILGRKDLGIFKKGALADITVFSTKEEWVYDAGVIESKSKNTPWLGERFTGRARHVLVGGRQVLQAGAVV